MRILVGTREIAGLLPDYAEGFRHLGHQVTTVVRYRNRFYPDIQYDIDLSGGESSEYIAQLILSHDIFLFQWGDSLLDANLDFHLIKRAGKRIISIFIGNDIRHYSTYQQEFGTDYKALGYAGDPIERPLHNLRIAEQFSDLIITDPNSSGMAVRPYMQVFLPLDLSRYRCEIPAREVPRVIHAPSTQVVKGTSIILPALEKLRVKGIRFDLRVMTNVTNLQVLEALMDTDVVIDQLHLPGGGKLTLEGMACGCAVASAVREELKPYFNLRPIWKIDPENIEQQLEQLLTDKELRLKLAAEGRAYVEQYHDRTQVAEQILNALADTDTGNLKYDYYPTFFTRNYRLPEEQFIPTYLKRLTAAIIQHHGLPAGVKIDNLLERGLISVEGLDMNRPLPVWSYPSGDRKPIVKLVIEKFEQEIPRAPSINMYFDPGLAAYYKTVAICPHPLIASNDLAALDLIQKGNQYIYCGHNQAAFSSYQKAVALEPNSAAAHFGLGNLYLSNALFEQAADHYLQTDNIYPGFGMTYFYLALANTFQNRADDALPILERAILSVPRWPREQVWIGDPHPYPPDGEGVAATLREGVRPIPRPLLYGHLKKDRRRIRGVLYFEDLPPSWIHPNLQIAIAPYFAFLYTLLNAASLHLTPGGGPLATTPFSPVEMDLYRLAGVEEVRVLN